MRVLLKKNVSKLGRIGEVVEVRPGYAKNYLLPQGLASKPTEGNVRAIEAERQVYLEQLAKEHAELEAKAELVRRKEVTIAARANEEGHLYGSIGPAQIAAALAAEGIFLEPENIVLDEPIRQLDKYDVQVRFAEDVTAMIHVWVVPHHEAEDSPEGESTNYTKRTNFTNNSDSGNSGNSSASSNSWNKEAADPDARAPEEAGPAGDEPA